MNMKDNPAASAVVVGLTLIVSGTAFVYWPAALIVAGVVLVALFTDF